MRRCDTGVVLLAALALGIGCARAPSPAPAAAPTVGTGAALTAAEQQRANEDVVFASVQWTVAHKIGSAKVGFWTTIFGSLTMCGRNAMLGSCPHSLAAGEALIGETLPIAGQAKYLGPKPDPATLDSASVVGIGDRLMHALNLMPVDPGTLDIKCNLASVNSAGVRPACHFADFVSFVELIEFRVNDATASAFIEVWTDAADRGIQAPDRVCLKLKRQNDAWAVASQGTWTEIDNSTENVCR
ncbi:MAG TPA: hypothetical protein VMH39_06130 [Gemmatimonadaceae bacterium]|nr:hypothetical protein [Gemmatimonadaceae bacterium]